MYQLYIILVKLININKKFDSILTIINLYQLIKEFVLIKILLLM